MVYLLSLVLLATLLGTALVTSANHTLDKPKKVEDMLAQSKLYDHFVAYTADQAKKTNGDTDQSGSVSLSDAAVQSAAKSAFPPQLIQQSVNTFINSNYAWLEGKTATPNFTIDLSAQKETFAQKVGRIVQDYTATLPVCTTVQAAQQQSTDPLAATCRPPEVTPEAAGAQVTQRLASTGDFLSNPVITASSINPKGNQQGKPYYQKLSHLPTLYRLSTKLPFVLGVLAILSAVGVIFISLERRKGVRKVGIVLTVAGVILIFLKFSSDFIFNRAEQKVFNSTDVGQLQQSLTNFAHRVESAMVKVDLLFGIAFLLLGLIILAVLMKTRRQEPKKPAVLGDLTGPDEPQAKNPLLISPRKRLNKRLPRDSILPLGAKPGGEAPKAPEIPAPKPKKPRRLIQ